MQCKLLGFKKTSFTAKDTGAKIEGLNLYVSYADNKVDGIACDRLFLTNEKAGNYIPKVGQTLEVEYNKYGKPDAVIAV